MYYLSLILSEDCQLGDALRTCDLIDDKGGCIIRLYKLYKLNGDVVLVSRGSAVCMATGYRPVLGSMEPPIQWVPVGHFLRVKLQWREAKHSHPTSAKVKKVWIYTSIPPYGFVAYCLVKHKENITFYFSLGLVIQQFIARKK
jgi:hypothetical protein